MSKNNNLVTQALILDTQKRCVPAEVKNEISDNIWAVYCLGNDNYYIHWNDEMEASCPITAKWLKDNNIETKDLLIHHWW